MPSNLLFFHQVHSGSNGHIALMCLKKKTFKRTNFQQVYSSAETKFFEMTLNHSCYLTFNLCSLRNSFISQSLHIKQVKCSLRDSFIKLMSWISEPLFWHSTESLIQLDSSTEVRWQKRTSHRHTTVYWSSVQLAILRLLLFIVRKYVHSGTNCHIALICRNETIQTNKQKIVVRRCTSLRGLQQWCNLTLW